MNSQLLVSIGSMLSSNLSGGAVAFVIKTLSRAQQFSAEKDEPSSENLIVTFRCLASQGIGKTIVLLPLTGTLHFFYKYYVLQPFTCNLQS